MAAEVPKTVEAGGFTFDVGITPVSASRSGAHARMDAMPIGASYTEPKSRRGAVVTAQGFRHRNSNKRFAVGVDAANKDLIRVHRIADAE